MMQEIDFHSLVAKTKKKKLSGSLNETQRDITYHTKLQILIYIIFLPH